MLCSRNRNNGNEWRGSFRCVFSNPPDVQAPPKNGLLWNFLLHNTDLARGDLQEGDRKDSKDSKAKESRRVEKEEEEEKERRTKRKDQFDSDWVEFAWLSSTDLPLSLMDPERPLNAPQEDGRQEMKGSRGEQALLSWVRRLLLPSGSVPFSSLLSFSLLSFFFVFRSPFLLN